MFCRHCGKKIDEKTNRCIYCGKKGVGEENPKSNFTDGFFQNHKKDEGFKVKFLNIWGKIPGLVRLLIVYALLNGLLYGGQELYYFKDTQKMNQLKSEMGSIDKDITRLESYAVGNGLYEPYYSQYKSNIDQYNKKADEYNKLADKSGKRWWLIPIPIGHGKTATK